jgi:hypothetical protein
LNKTYVGSSLKSGSENISFIDTTLEGASPITRTTTKTMSLTVVKPTPGELQLKTIQSLAGLNTALKNIKPKMDLLPRVTATSKANAIAATRVVAGGSFQNQIPLKWRGVYDVPRSSTVSNLNNIYTSTQGTTRLGNKYDLTLTPTSIFSTRLIQKQRIDDIGITGDIYRTTGKQITGTETEERIGDIYGVGIRTELGTRMKVDELTRMGMGTITEQDMIQSQKQDDLLGMKQLQLQRTDLLYDSMRITVPITVPITIPIEPTIPKPPFIPMFGGDEGEPKKRKEKVIIDKGTGYDVYVKQRSMYHGKVRKPTYYKKVNKKPLDESSALALGGSIADDSSAITFKIKPTKGKGNKPQEIVKPWENIKHKFTKKGSVYIERTPYRIDTLGEQKDVSAIGWRTNRMKGLKRDLLGNNNKLFEEKSKDGKRVKYF